MLPNDPIQLQDLWGAKTALGQGHQRKRSIHVFCSLWIYKRKWSKQQLFSTKSKEFKQLPGTVCWVGGSIRLHASVRCGLQFLSQWMDFLKHLAHSIQGTLVVLMKSYSFILSQILYLGEDVNEMQMFRNIKISFAESTVAGKKANGITNSVFYLFCLLRSFRYKNTKKLLKTW